VHVLAGLTAVATGATAALSRKGSPRHVRTGRWYYRAITTVFGTAIVLAAMRPRQDYHLALIGLVAYTAATLGYQHRRRHRPGDSPHIAGMGLSYIAMLTAFYVDNGPHLPVWTGCQPSPSGYYPAPSAYRSPPAPSTTLGDPPEPGPTRTARWVHVRFTGIHSQPLDH
jgi:hypothetical protein